MDLLVNIDVDDLDRAVQFYTSAFEVKVGRRFGANGIELLGGSAQVRDYRRHWTPVHLDFVVTAKAL
jgi:catechol 2,3-dioxygenase-like lactoylglutathione lyase family enzyme